MQTERQLRRAEERRLRKLNRKAQGAGSPLQASQSANEPASTNRQLANAENAQRSTGPVTAEGKRTSSRNALRHGLTAVSVLIPGDNAAAYQSLCDRFHRDWAPVLEREIELVQMLADTQWRLNRVPMLEAGFWAAGRLEFQELYPEQPAELRAHLIDNQVFKIYERQLRNLHLQESRLRRYYQATQKELLELQERWRGEERRQARFAEQNKPAPYLPTVPVLPSNPLTYANGFVSTTPQAPRPTHAQASNPNPPGPNF